MKRETGRYERSTVAGEEFSAFIPEVRTEFLGIRPREVLARAE